MHRNKQSTGKKPSNKFHICDFLFYFRRPVKLVELKKKIAYFQILSKRKSSREMEFETNCTPA